VLVTNPFGPGSWTGSQIENISKGWWVLLGSGVLSVVAGGIIILTDWSVADLAFVLGVVLVFRGFLTLFSVPIDGSIRAWSIVVGLLEIGVGIAVWTWPGPTLLVIATWIGWLLLFRGVMTISGAVVARSIIPYWGIVLGVGILEVAASFYLLARPGLTLVATILAIGLTTMFYGVVEIVAAFEVKHLPRRLAQTARTVDGTSTHPLESATA
jgi:uncharacterized membrane protein HdeD (DUF308 family)